MNNYKKVIVDGNKVRNYLDIECPPFAQRQEDPMCFNVRIYIPKDEIWIDQAYADEYDNMYSWEFGLKNLVGKKYLARREEKVKELEKLRQKNKISFLDYTVSRKKVNNTYTVFIKGELIRKYFDPDFIFGGHHYVYPYIPENEIWIDIKSDKQEVPFIYLHEGIERILMKQGRNYEEGHEVALCYEKIERRKNGACYPGDADYLRPKTSLTDFFRSKIN